MWPVWVLFAVTLTAGQARAEGCDLSSAVGYQIVTAKTIEAYIEDGQRTLGYVGCQPGRVLVFTDNAAVRCKAHALQTLRLPRAYLFARGETDLKLCVGDYMMDVAPAR